MKLLLRQVTIADPSSSFHGNIKDILIIDGQIVSIADALNEDDAKVISGENLFVSQGWVDVFAHFNDPGFEYKETIESGIAAAAAGGYTDVFVLPNTAPVAATKSVVEYIVQKAKHGVVNVHPLGAVTKNAEGKELAEMYDMRNSGAIAFTDGIHPVQTSGLLLKALQYVKAFDGTIIQLPVDRSINKHGLMNEGITSTQLGLPGLPAIAEELFISRDIELTKYTGSKLHITGVSTAKGLQLIREAKATGINVTCSVTPYHLYYCDEDLMTYDTNLKVDPPLRSRSEMMALRNGIEDGTIDCIASHHLPQDWDHKVCEFEYAQPGMIGLQTTFAVLNHLFPQVSTDRVCDLLANNARAIFGLSTQTINENTAASLTVFTRKGNTAFIKNTNNSKSNNSAFFHIQLAGAVIGVVNKDQVYLNQIPA